MADPLFSETAAVFRHARLQLGWSQELFAEKALVSDVTIRKTEAGIRISARTHKALVDAINKARAACQPPVGPLTLEFPTARAPVKVLSEPPEGCTLAVSVAGAAADPVEYPEIHTEELEVNDDGGAPNGLIPEPRAVRSGDSLGIQEFEDNGIFRAGTDTWRVNDACEGLVIFGATGSGKTSGSGRYLAMS